MWAQSSTISGSHPAHTALHGAPGWDRIPCASVPADPAVPASRWAEMLPKKTLSLGGQISAKDQDKTHLAPQFRIAVGFREVVKHLHSYLPTPVTGKDTHKSPLGQGKAKPTLLDTDEVAACLKQLGFSSVFFPICY